MLIDYGFANHCNAVGRPDAVNEICNAFTYLSTVAILWDSVLCLHGFLCPDLESYLLRLEIEQKPDPEDFTQGSLLEGIVWSDMSYRSTPANTFTGNYLRGNVGYLCTLPLARSILERLGFTCMFRAHQHVEEGYAAHGQIYTLNSNTVRDEDIATAAKLTKDGVSNFNVEIQCLDLAVVAYTASHPLKVLNQCKI